MLSNRWQYNTGRSMTHLSHKCLSYNAIWQLKGKVNRSTTRQQRQILYCYSRDDSSKGRKLNYDNVKACRTMHAIFSQLILDHVHNKQQSINQYNVLMVTTATILQRVRPLKTVYRLSQKSEQL